MTQFVVTLQLNLRDLIDSLTTREEGQDMIEYALLAGLISIVAISVIVLISPYLIGFFQNVAGAFGSAGVP